MARTVISRRDKEERRGNAERHVAQRQEEACDAADLQAYPEELQINPRGGGA